MTDVTDVSGTGAVLNSLLEPMSFPSLAFY